MPRPGTNGQRITREDLQAAYSQVVGEGEATARAAAPRALAVAGAVGMDTVVEPVALHGPQPAESHAWTR